MGIQVRNAFDRRYILLRWKHCRNASQENMSIVCGCYERCVIGFDVSKEKEGCQGPASISRRFSYAASMGPVKCVAASDGYVACGGYDDCIYLYDLKRGKDLGALVEHQGAITCLEFFPAHGKASHLLSGAKDGVINVWECGRNWDHLKSLKGHKKEINAIAVHPTGMLCLSTSKDGFLRLWDLGRGRCTFRHRLSGEGDVLKLLPGGRQYAVGGRKTISVHQADNPDAPSVDFEHKKDVLALCAPSDDVLLTGGEGGWMCVLDAKSGNMPIQFRAHDSRIRSVCTITDDWVDHVGLSLPQKIATASTDGSVRVWDARMLPTDANGKVLPLAEVKANARITCMQYCKDFDET